VQFNPINSELKAPGTNLLTLQFEEPLSNFAYRFYLRLCSEAALRDALAAAQAREAELRHRLGNASAAVGSHIISTLSSTTSYNLVHPPVFLRHVIHHVIHPRLLR
jgi:hypothetical protein